MNKYKCLPILLKSVFYEDIKKECGMTFGNEYEWTVIGAGPAGIAAVGKLIDNHIDPKKILWIDPEFKVGDFGKKWSKVPSNTKVSLFINFLNSCNSFEFLKTNELFDIQKISADETCELDLMVQPLQYITNILKSKVVSNKDIVSSLKMKNRYWLLEFNNQNAIISKNVIMAIGAEEKILSYPNLKTIPLDIALNKHKLIEYCHSDDIISVFGSSHSAILVIRNILENCPKTKILNFYKSPLCYALNCGNAILNDNTGLKGTTAQWAKENLHGNLPENLNRFFANEENLKNELYKCTHVVYAIGFQRRKIILEGVSDFEYNSKTGIIAPGLFGFGIAFPELKCDSFGNEEHRVGLWKFMNYINNVLPIWLRYSI